MSCDIHQINLAGIRWQTTAAFAPLLEAVLNTRGQVIKESSAKIVARHGDYFIKRYRYEHLALRPLKFFFKRSQARQEWRLAAALQTVGMPIVEHVALGERWSARGLLESILITRAFDGVPLDQCRDFDLTRVVEFVQRLATTRYFHRDLHPANLLVNERTGDIRLVDLHGMKLTRKLPAERIEDEMLAQLSMTLVLPVTEEVAGYGQFKRRRAFEQRARRCLKNNRDFAARRIGRLQWNVRRDHAAALESVLRAPDEFIARGKMLKAGRSSTVAVANGVVLKRFNFRRVLRPLKDLFRESRARAAFRKAYHLELCGIPTARVLAAGDERVLGLIKRGFVVMEEIRGAAVASEWAGDLALGAHRMGQLLAQLHNEGFSHRDLKETNIVFDQNGSPHLIDLEGLRFHRETPDEIAAANLRRLARGASACGRLNRRTAIVFLLAYCRARGVFPSQLFPER